MYARTGEKREGESARKGWERDEGRRTGHIEEIERDRVKKRARHGDGDSDGDGGGGGGGGGGCDSHPNELQPSCVRLTRRRSVDKGIRNDLFALFTATSPENFSSFCHNFEIIRIYAYPFARVFLIGIKLS